MKKAVLEIDDPVTKIATVSSLGQIAGGEMVRYRCRAIDKTVKARFSSQDSRPDSQGQILALAWAIFRQKFLDQFKLLCSSHPFLEMRWPAIDSPVVWYEFVDLRGGNDQPTRLRKC